jgi:hypothetical protein
VALLAGIHWPAAAAVPAEAPAIAAPTETTPDPNHEKARGQFREGLTLLDAGEYARALACFQRAYEAWNNPKILLNIATAQRALGQRSKAANNYARYQRIAEPDPARAREVEQILATLDAGLGRLIVSHLDAHQRLWLNDEELALEIQQPIRIEPGEHTLRIVKPGVPPDLRRIAVWPGELLRVDAAQTPAVKSLDAPPATDEREERRAAPHTLRLSRVGVLARADVDVARRGALGAVGAALALTDFLRATGGALLGAHQGGWLGLELVPSGRGVAPVLGLSAPFFFMDGLYPGVSGELGVRVALTRRITPFARASVTHFPSAPTGYVRTLVIPSLGVEVGL